MTLMLLMTTMMPTAVMMTMIMMLMMVKMMATMMMTMMMMMLTMMSTMTVVLRPRFCISRLPLSFNTAGKMQGQGTQPGGPSFACTPG